MDYSKLNYPSLLDDTVTKTIAYSHNVFFTDELKNKKLKIDGSLTLLNDKAEIQAVSFLKQFVSERRGESNLNGTFFCFVHDIKKRNRAYDAMDRVRVFIAAVRIFTENRADALYDFSIGDIKKKEYFLPFDLNAGDYDTYNFRDTSVIRTKKDFNVIKTIHKKLIEAKLEKSMHYSKLYNATEFFRHAYDEHWTLLKTTLFFTSLESLFSDSSKSEVTEKIAVRTAYLLHPKDSLKRKEVYTFIKRGYEIRSLFVHGSNTEARVNKIMNRFAKEKGIDYYGFHDDFLKDLNSIVCGCLRRCYLHEPYFHFFTNEKYKEQEEQAFYSDIVL
jgi:hypothetical protein